MDKNPFSRFLGKIYDRFIRIRGEPRNIALGFALGLFVGMSPAMGFQTAIVIFLAALLKWNKVSAAVGVWITNPVTAPILYAMTYFTGAKLLGLKRAYKASEELHITTISKMLDKAPEILWALILGGVVIGLPLAVAGYYFSYSIVRKYQEGIKERIMRQKERLAERKKRVSKKMRTRTKRRPQIPS